MNIFYFCICVTFLSQSHGSFPPKPKLLSISLPPQQPLPIHDVASQNCATCLQDIFSLEDLQFAFRNLKSIIDTIAIRIDTKLSKSNTIKLTGNVICLGDKCTKSIPIDSIITITVQDTSRQDAPSITIATQKIIVESTRLIEFPFSYEIEYDRSFITKGDYIIRADIRKDTILLFTTDTHFSIVGEQFQPLNKVDFHVISLIPQSLPTMTTTTPFITTTTIKSTTKIPPSMGSLSQIQPADDIVKGYVNMLKPRISKYLNNYLQVYSNLLALEAVSYRSQLVAGKNYFVKVKAEGFGHLHVRVFIPLSFYGKDPELAGIHWGPFTASDPIEYIDAHDNMEIDDYEDQD